MQKRLVKVGNSLALVIDRPLLSLLCVNRTTRLSIGVEGGRYVITPLGGDGDPRPPSKREALNVVHELQLLGRTQQVFDQVCPVKMRLGSYIARLDGPLPPTIELDVTMRRMAVLRKRLAAGWYRDEAVASAISAAPYNLPTGVETRLDDAEAGPQRISLDALLPDDDLDPEKD